MKIFFILLLFIILTTTSASGRKIRTRKKLIKNKNNSSNSNGLGLIDKGQVSQSQPQDKRLNIESDITSINEDFVPEVDDGGRYSIHFVTGPSESNATTTSVDEMAATAITDMMSQIRDPFKHGVSAAFLAALYIGALISMIIFATTGSIAFICSFSDCRNFFLGMKPAVSARPFDSRSGAPLLLRKRDYRQTTIDPWIEMDNMRTIHASFDKFNID